MKFLWEKEKLIAIIEEKRWKFSWNVNGMQWIIWILKTTQWTEHDLWNMSDPSRNFNGFSIWMENFEWFEENLRKFKKFQKNFKIISRKFQDNFKMSGNLHENF